MMFGQEIFLSACNFSQGIGLGNNGSNFIRLDVSHEILKNDVLLKRTTEQREIFQIERSNVDLADRTGDCPGCGVPTTTTQDVQQAGPHRAGDEVNNDIHAGLAQLAEEVDVAIENAIGSKIPHRLCLRSRAKCNNSCTPPFRQLYRCRTNTT